jgi:carotenoid cleavage dioxygenase
LPYRVPYGFHGAFMPIPSRNELYNTSHINFVEKLTDLTRTLDAIKFKGF